jgi:hypothetical protein
MSDERFIELLNLYVDHQLSPEEAAELEKEIRVKPERRRTYQQYCRMQKACRSLFEQERSHAPASRALVKALADADRKIVAFPEQGRSRSRMVYLSGLAAAAACVALVFMVQNNPVETPATQSALAPDAGNVSPAVVASQPVVIPPAEPHAAGVEPYPEYYSVLPARKSGQTRAEGSGLFLAGASSQPDQGRLDWMKQVQIAPLQLTKFEDLKTESRNSPQSDVRVFTTRYPASQDDVEMTVFEFQR